MSSLREQLVGAWELIDYQAYAPNDRSKKIHPMGEKAQGIIMYTPDGYMSAQLQRMDDSSGDVYDIGNYIAYTGRFFIDEEGDDHGPFLVHEMRNSNLQRLMGDRQRRLVEIKDESDGRYLYLSVKDPMKYAAEERVPLVRWRRLEKNLEKREPSGKVQ